MSEYGTSTERSGAYERGGGAAPTALGAPPPSGRVIRPATHSDLVRFHGHDKFLRSRAWVALIDGSPVGVAGVFRDAMGQLVLFEEHKPEMEADRGLMLRGLLTVRRLLRTLREPVVSCASPDYACADLNLLRLGFEATGIPHVYVRRHNG